MHEQGGGARRGGIPRRALLRRTGQGLRTILGLRPGGFFIPYGHAASVQARDYPALLPLFTAAQPRFQAVLASIESHRQWLERIARGGPGLAGDRPARFDQDWFPRLDAAAAYALVRDHAPRRIVEIGSGHSSRFMAQAIVDGGLATAMTCVDPQPRAPLTGLPVRHEARLFGDGDARRASELEADDILFIDSSHIGMPGTDVDRIILDLLPRLRPGVLVHFHDIFLPDPYPEDFTWRGYNEHLAVGALLLGGAYELIFSSHYIAKHSGFPTDSWLAAMPARPNAHEASLWLRKVV